MVLDSSIVGCWCFPDESSPVADAAIDQLRRDGAIVPVLWWFEVRNVLVINERRGRTDQSDSATFLADLDTLPIAFDRQADSAPVLAVARAHRLTVYDAAYLERSARGAARDARQ